jgi:hypothetical protein
MLLELDASYRAWPGHVQTPGWTSSEMHLSTYWVLGGTPLYTKVSSFPNTPSTQDNWIIETFASWLVQQPVSLTPPEDQHFWIAETTPA